MPWRRTRRPAADGETLASSSWTRGGSSLPPQGFWRTRLCRFFARGACRNGPWCAFAHGTEELRSRRRRPAVAPNSEHLAALVGDLDDRARRLEAAVSEGRGMEAYQMSMEVLDAAREGVGVLRDLATALGTTGFPTVAEVDRLAQLLQGMALDIARLQDATHPRPEYETGSECSTDIGEERWCGSCGVASEDMSWCHEALESNDTGNQLS